VGHGLRATAESGKGRPGEIDYRLARSARLGDYRVGRLSRNEVCDAQTELLRNAIHCGRATRRTCPICEHRHLVEVTYVFGPRLPKSGRCITAQGELATLAAKTGRHEAWVVEVCTECRWNHLTRSFPLTDENA
jgi:hypothetical protein